MDRNLGPFKRIIERFVGNTILGPRMDYTASYPATAITQNGDGTLEIKPDDERLPSLSSVPIRYGVPGVSAQIANGGRVLLAFAGGDPAKPIATVWEAASVTSLTVAAGTVKLGGAGASHPLIFGDDFSSASGPFGTLMQAVATAVGGAGTPATASTAAGVLVTAIQTYQTAVASQLSGTTKTI